MSDQQTHRQAGQGSRQTGKQAERWMPPLSQANAARAKARKMRGEWLVLIAEGVFGPDDLLREAATHAGRPLRRLSLRQVLSAQPDCSEERAVRILRKICDTLRLDPHPPLRDLTVSWLLDARAGGTRLLAYVDAITPRTPRWPGFPVTATEPRKTRGSQAAQSSGPAATNTTSPGTTRQAVALPTYS